MNEEDRESGRRIREARVAARKAVAIEYITLPSGQHGARRCGLIGLGATRLDALYELCHREASEDLAEVVIPLKEMLAKQRGEEP